MLVEPRTASRQGARRKLTGRALRPGSAVTAIGIVQQFDRAQRRCHRAERARSLNASRNTGPSRWSTGQARAARAGRVGLVGTGQALGFGDAGRELLPANRGCDRPVQDRHRARLGLDQRGPQFGEQPRTLSLTRSSVTQQCDLLPPRLGAAEHAADRPVEQGDTVIGQAHDRVQHRGNQRGTATQRR